MEEFHRTICCFSSFESHNLLIRVYPRIYILYGRPILLITLSPFVDSVLSSNQHSVRWTHFVDTIFFVIFQYTEDISRPGKQKVKLKLDNLGRVKVMCGEFPFFNANCRSVPTSKDVLVYTRILTPLNQKCVPDLRLCFKWKVKVGLNLFF